MLRATFRDLQHRRTYVYRIRDLPEEISSTTSSSADSFLPYFCDLTSVSTSDPNVSSAQWRYGLWGSPRGLVISVSKY